ncbi:UNVERIFIED_CONTAM: hypothetical protein RF648_18815 [Kocuria sp. CPCC 205274]|uniref:Uncharacterized protein n=1 Tax=Herbiconiux daphne TaxID=2970914 RepID=A0ABT2H904_9MICO|nr:hypothetical protein [Herbiconiux daphne]MCS5736416.1 hypothetical protein [Herbiconiux daphne]
MSKNKIYKIGVRMPMANFAPTAGTVTNIIGLVNQHEADINTKVLENLQHNSLGI